MGSSAEEGASRRRSPRVLVNINVDYTCEGLYLFASITDISAFGVFIRTNTPDPPGSELQIKFSAPDGGDPLEAAGRVTWVQPYVPGSTDNQAGMGVELLDLTPSQQEQLVALLGEPRAKPE